MTSQLIPVFNGTIANETALLVNARELHSFLGVGKMFAHWIKDRLEEYGFVENQDYVIACQNGQAKGRGGHNRKDYHLTLDTAKELAMVERNEKGRQIRRYFIECEKKLRNRAPTTSSLPGCHRDLLIHFGDDGNVAYTEFVPDGAMICTYEAFAGYLEKQGWMLVNRNEIKNMTVGELLNIPQ
ncbi:antA/AntB antirepressor family protein [Escherichia coli]|uniref:antA/AntB antirepressor family protein n=1 Tax=Escherichia coli TaxID=562 RepID=UPI000BE183F2|nr:antA/AntB antirepressor family protein [Escherichia coli]